MFGDFFKRWVQVFYLKMRYGCMKKKITMSTAKRVSLEDGCNMHLENCKQRNLREGTIRHYKDSYVQFMKFFSADMPLCEMTERKYYDYVSYLKGRLDSDISVQTYSRDLRTVLYFLMREGYVRHFKVKEIKVDKHAIETYTEDELMALLKKPNVKKCRFLEYQAWVMTNFLFSTGLRQRSLIHLQIRDVDLYNAVVNVKVTKNRKPLIIPLNRAMMEILKEFLRYRQCENKEAYLFCNAYGEQLRKSTHYAMMSAYNKARGVDTTGIHRYRHTFAKQWILNGGSVVSLSKILGHSNLKITENYLNLLVTDLAKQVEEVNLLDKFAAKKKIRM